MNTRTLAKIDELEALPERTKRQDELLDELNRMNNADAAVDLREDVARRRDEAAGR